MRRPGRSRGVAGAAIACGLALVIVLGVLANVTLLDAQEPDGLGRLSPVDPALRSGSMPAAEAPVPTSHAGTGPARGTGGRRTVTASPAPASPPASDDHRSTEGDHRDDHREGHDDD